MYHTSWSIYHRNLELSQLDAARITHINYAFANIRDGKCVLGDPWSDVERHYAGDTWDQPLRGQFNQLLKLKAAYPHLRTLISVGGWTWSGAFSDAAATAASRARFASSCVEFVRAYGFDGLDIDWEYPVEGGLPANGRRPEDRENYTRLLQAIRDQMEVVFPGEPKLLTIAAAARPSWVDNMEVSELDTILDWINLMTYDFNGAWQPTTGHLAPLYQNPNSANPTPIWSVDASVRAYLAAGLRPSKLVVGMPFYGRGWTGIPDPSGNGGLFAACGSGAATCPLQGDYEEGLVDYTEIVTRGHLSASTRYWDDVSKVPYLYNSATGAFISYDDPESLCLKSDYIVENELGGAMAWESNGDHEKELQRLVYDRIFSGTPCDTGAAGDEAGKRKLQATKDEGPSGGRSSSSRMAIMHSRKALRTRLR